MYRISQQPENPLMKEIQERLNELLQNVSKACFEVEKNGGIPFIDYGEPGKIIVRPRRDGDPKFSTIPPQEWYQAIMDKGEDG